MRRILGVGLLCLGLIGCDMETQYTFNPIVRAYVDGENRKYQEDKAKVTMSIEWQGDVIAENNSCSYDFPLKITVINRHSDKTVYNISFDIEARRPGRSTDITAGSSDLLWDWIVPPNTTTWVCWAVPALSARDEKPVQHYFHSTLDWSINRRYDNIN